MPKYRKKPVIIEAEQFNGKSYDLSPHADVPKAIQGTSQTGRVFMEFPVLEDERGEFLIIPTLEGNHRANPGDWIITGIKGEKYPCKPDIFEATYQAEETDFRQRVIQEKAALDSNIERLGGFFQGEQFKALPDEEKRRLLRQHDLMSNYSWVLRDRIAAFP